LEETFKNGRFRINLSQRVRISLFFLNFLISWGGKLSFFKEGLKLFFFKKGGFLDFFPKKGISFVGAPTAPQKLAGKEWNFQFWWPLNFIGR